MQPLQHPSGWLMLAPFGLLHKQNKKKKEKEINKIKKHDKKHFSVTTKYINKV